jgi:hypothetical protein
MLYAAWWRWALAWSVEATDEFENWWKSLEVDLKGGA